MYFSLQAWLLAASQDRRGDTFSVGVQRTTCTHAHNQELSRAYVQLLHERFTNGQVQQAQRPQSAKYFAQHCASNDLGRSEIKHLLGEHAPRPPWGRSSSAHALLATRKQDDHRLSTPLPQFLNTPLSSMSKYLCMDGSVSHARFTRVEMYGCCHVK